VSQTLAPLDFEINKLRTLTEKHSQEISHERALREECSKRLRNIEIQLLEIERELIRSRKDIDGFHDD
jgi:predicted  nucleic acid-binding Zn-ribbon protein